jgi:alpha-tubulin suppressor-like RCC1 family protein
MSTNTRSRALLIIGGSALLLAGCTDQSPVGPTRTLRPATPSRSVSVSSENVFLLSVEVSGYGLERPLTYNIPITNGGNEGTLATPAGEGRSLVVRAHDQYGNVTHEGEVKLEAIRDGENEPVGLALRPVREGKEIEVKLDLVGEKPLGYGTVVIESDAKEVAEGRAMTMRAYLVDEKGTRQDIDPSMVHWAVSDPRGGRMMLDEKEAFRYFELDANYKNMIYAIITDRVAYFYPRPRANPYVDVTAGTSHTCAIRMLGDVYCWGFNTNEQLGSPVVATCGATLYCADRAKPLSAGGSWRSSSAGANHTCAIDMNRAAWCWGLGTDGQLGANVPVGANTHTPLQVPGHSFDQISGGLYHTCGVDLAGAAWCWGSNWAGELGDGKATPGGPTPVRVSGGQLWRQISANFWFTCGRDASMNTYCWGTNWWGELGHPTYKPSLHVSRDTVPRLTDNVLHGVELSQGQSQVTCFAALNGGNFCWGNNSSGAVGTGGAAGAVTTPTQLTVGPQFSRFATGSGFTCAIDATTSAAHCWGANSVGQLGDGGTTPHNTPAPVSTTLAFSRIAAGGQHACGVTTAGAVFCWGAGTYGQLGNGTHSGNSSVPVQVIQ